jgi:DNA-binding MarR family transcriptional regulator
MKKSIRPDLSRAIEDLVLGLRRVTGISVFVTQSMAERLGINATDLECLDFLLLHGPQTAGAIAEHSGLTTGAVTGIVDRLQRAKLARRTRDRIDRRKVRIAAAQDADARVKLIADPVKVAMASILDEYSEENLRLLLDFVARAHGSLTRVLAENFTVPKAVRKTDKMGVTCP